MAASPYNPNIPVPKPLMDKTGVYIFAGDPTKRSTNCIVYGFSKTRIFAVAFSTPVECVEMARDLQLRPTLWKGLPYPVEQAAKAMLNTGRTITGQAKKILQALAEGTYVHAE
jgi:hypothetical protein